MERNAKNKKRTQYNDKDASKNNKSLETLIHNNAWLEQLGLHITLLQLL